ncbi:methylaspartate mutase subunit S [Paenibacillus sp. JCM 10914]|uniref:methylaspartate mutase subunit S n=1 Tax=Paenibacillus sp. JCM 10914 TaxID=1236974 RepID=UPI000569335E|nr:methylaspartate mutase subunit S [Paenibacillus sp. JCM 10914]
MKIRIVLGVIGDDCHSVGNKILEIQFTDAGLQVINIGVLCSQEEFVRAAVESRAHAIIVSSLNGHGELACMGLREKCVEYGVSNILLYVGGNLVVGHQEWTYIRDKFTEMGFDRVYPPGTSAQVAIEHLKEDLQHFAEASVS